MAQDPIILVPPVSDKPVPLQVVPVIPAAVPPNNPTHQQFNVTAEQITAFLAAAGDLLPSAKKFWPQLSALVVAMVSLGGAMGWWAAPKVVPVQQTSPVGVVQSPVVSPKVPSPPAFKSAVLTIYTLDGKSIADQMFLSALSANGVSFRADPYKYESGSHYPFADKDVLLPCAVLASADGKVIDVAQLGTVGELTEFVFRHVTKK